MKIDVFLVLLIPTLSSFLINKKKKKKKKKKHGREKNTLPKSTHIIL